MGLEGVVLNSRDAEQRAWGPLTCEIEGPRPGRITKGFKDKVQAAKILNERYNLDGTIVNELGALTNGETEL